jgi:molecular chaperone GrpE
MEEALKDSLVAQFRRYLDGVEELPPEAAVGSEADLFTLFVEMAALRTEVRTESRLVKDALDQFRDVFATVQSSQGALEQELQRAREREREQARTLLRPVLLDLLDLRDRLTAALQAAPAPPPRRWPVPWRRPAAPSAEPWQEGQRLTLRRLDRMLQERRVTPVELLGRRFDPQLGRVVATRPAAGVAAGIVLEEVRAGFLWEDQPLRLAEVVVSKPAEGEGR